MNREEAFHRLKDRHRYRPYVLPTISKAWKWQSISEHDKIIKKYLQSSLPASNYTNKEEGARGTPPMLYSLSSFT